MAVLRTAALNLLRLAGFHSIREGLQTVRHDIKALLANGDESAGTKPELRLRFSPAVRPVTTHQQP